MELSTEVLMDLHRRMVRIRLFEETAGELAEAAKLPGFLQVLLISFQGLAPKLGILYWHQNILPASISPGVREFSRECGSPSARTFPIT